MIDFHTHILPNVDDGSKSIEKSINLIKEAKEAGFNEIILTPHYYEGTYEEIESKRMSIMTNLKEALKNENIEINLHMANEIFISNKMIDFIKEKKASSINATKYILFELPFNNKPMNLFDVVYEILGNKYIPILAHPERYLYVQKNFDVVEELADMGVLMQCNFGSIDGMYGREAKKTVKKLLKNDMVHFLGSDVHKKESIYPKIPKILSKIKKIIGEEKLEEITNTNPKMVLENKDITLA